MREIYFIHDQQESPSQRVLFLEQSGYNVTQFTGGNECLEAIRKEKPDLVLSDILIDGDNGFDFCRRLRNLFSAKELPVILTSKIYRARAFREEAKSAGAQAYFLRPIRLEELVREVNELLGLDTDAKTPPTTLPPIGTKDERAA